MLKRLPPLNSLKAFESAARHLSFTKAADELFVTQAAVSHQIKSLESFLSMKLFHRKNRSLLLTEEGQSYFHDLRDIFVHLQEATQRLVTLGTKGAITIATPPSFASQWLVPRLHQFSAQHSDIDVRIKAVDADEGFLDDSVDIAVFYGRGSWSGLASTKLLSEYLTPMCSPRLLERGKPLGSLEDLSQHTLLHDNTRIAWKNWLSAFGIKNINVNQGPIFSHTMLVLQAACIGQGVALSDTVLAKPEIESGRLICPFNEKIESKLSHYLVCKESQVEQSKIKVFSEWMLSQAK
ncbi:LysR family transcriptional regulator, glycine cleavage system transcriptional activator [Glaciecola punicea ACAM 611]|jgi:LysR family glycine cleavage system transcriptional activator|uniref:LysR family transcriptional regulator, glycine cleavage system transcriptional activator n=1 Tax=Glaciecola punicea ACAM 611 TaxID=1121923 RepID=H5T981_9ALTE|nr:transcriptional regulator GcvA [Glaciecola punicea]OFA31725.1 transcriptional regulator [Glaciecola punicea]GAB54858.1 LysR family transcriptional regulator, glycine cleavage system transcriptional activator [Glaciecola punicea ACAM 611]